MAGPVGFRFGTTTRAWTVCDEYDPMIAHWVCPDCRIPCYCGGLAQSLLHERCGRHDDSDETKLSPWAEPGEEELIERGEVDE